MTQRKVLVSGVTGTQGGAVVQALLKDRHEVVGITRNIKSEKSRQLASLGVELVSVNFTEGERLVSFMETVDTVFSMTTPFEGGMEEEIKQGLSMANAAKEAGVGHFIFNSVGDADKATGIPHFDSKFEIEKHIKNLGLPYTIIAPTYFMDNIYFPFMMEGLKQGVLKMAMPPDIKLQQIAVEDIGKFVTHVVNERENMFGMRINISGDELSGEEAAGILSRISGKNIRYEGFNPDFLRQQSEDMALMYEWFIKSGYTANINDLRKYGFLTYREWAEKQDWKF